MACEGRRVDGRWLRDFLFGLGMAFVIRAAFERKRQCAVSGVSARMGSGIVIRGG